MAIAATGQLNLQALPSCGSRTVDCFQKLEQIGEGTYAQVYRAKEIQTGEIVALKKIRMENEKEGFPITAIREIKILQKLHHENVVKLKEIVSSPEKDEQGRPGGTFMVFEYMDHDLAGLTRSAVMFTVPQIKCYMRQLLTGLHYCHINQVLHRDIKGANLLLDNKGNLKLADFGLARSFVIGVNANLTNRVITLWYRPPELLLGSTKYGPAVDMWSVGCIFAELLDGKPLFPGKDESEQISKIFELCGAPDESNWPGVTKLPWYTNLKPNRPLKKRLRDHFRLLDRDAMELLEKMLVLDPAQRISTRDALDAEYFWNDPLPCDPKSLPTYESSHEFQTKQKRQQQRHHEEAGKRQKLQHPPAHARLLPMKQTVQAHAQRQARPNQQQRQYEETTEHQKLQTPAQTRPLPFQQSGQAHTQSQTGPNQQKREHEEAEECQKLQHRLLPFQQSGQVHAPSQTGVNQQQRLDEEATKHQQLHYPIAHTHPRPNQQSSQSHAQSQTGVNQQQRQQEEAMKHQKLHYPPAHTRPMPNQQSGHSHAQSQTGVNQQQRQHEEATKHQKLHYPPAHTRPMPNQQSGQSHAQRQSGPNQPMHGSQPPVPSGPGHRHGYPRGPSRYSQSGNSSGGRDRPDHGIQGDGRGYEQHGLGPAYGPSGMRGMGPRGGASSVSESGQNYQRGGFYDGHSTARGSNMMGRKYDQQYGSR